LGAILLVFSGLAALVSYMKYVEFCAVTSTASYDVV